MLSLELSGLCSCCSKQGLPSSFSAQDSHCGGISCGRARTLGSKGISSCGTWARQFWHLLFAESWRWLHLTLSGRHGLKDVGSVCLPTRDTPLPFRCWVGLKHWAQSCPPLLCVRTQTALPPCGSSPPRVPSQSIFLLPLFRVLLGLLAFSRVYCN